MMSTLNSEIIQKLKLERSILVDGGYGRSVRTPWRPTEFFRDSITCLNFGEVEKVHPCTQCVLTRWVNSSHDHEAFPCHFIPLNSEGETIDSLLRAGDTKKLEELLLGWLDQTIQQLEAKNS